MSRIHIDTMFPHGLCDLIDDAIPGGLDAQVLLDFNYVIGGASPGVDALGPEHVPQPQSLGIDDVVPRWLLRNECPGDGVDASDGDTDDLPPQRF